MKKAESEITMADKQEAKRRIEGSLAPESDNPMIRLKGANVS